jgi:hypothetical protein
MSTDHTRTTRRLASTTRTTTSKTCGMTTRSKIYIGRKGDANTHQEDEEKVKELHVHNLRTKPQAKDREKEVRRECERTENQFKVKEKWMQRMRRMWKTWKDCKAIESATNRGCGVEVLMRKREGCERTEEALLSSLRRISRALISRSNVNHSQNPLEYLQTGLLHMEKHGIHERMRKEDQENLVHLTKMEGTNETFSLIYREKD